MGEHSYLVNVERSIVVRKNLIFISKELGLSYTLIGKKAGFPIQILSSFATKRRNLNDRSLDRLEPIVNAYLMLT